ncbi:MULTISPECIES: hypothetical protein [Streptacidiphilus]|uniref:DUF3558 domain-containing protein n=1 Tax=Streptacidiphilus cavernicola TaxID=3342716 RepID=A0ABV6UGP3_9ACTN|nr:hypothetical protein [Streptacidiphilus jeojiense]
MSELTEPTPAPTPTPAPAPASTPVPVPAPPQFDPSTVWAVPPLLSPAPPRNRTWLRTALRWTTAVVVCAAVGTGAAFAVAAPRRTDIPGLKTPTDGRYAFPALTLPALPSGAVGPAEQKTSSGVEETHAADLRQLLLPMPVGGQADASYPGRSGWYSTTAFAQKFVDASGMAKHLQDDGVRHIAATAWTGPDGTRTEIYLLQFRSSSSAGDLNSLTCDTSPAAAPDALVDPEFSAPDIPTGIFLSGRAGDAQGGHPAARVTCFDHGEVAAVVMMTNPSKVNPVVAQQVATLQSELLLG